MAHASRALIPAEMNYNQIKKEVKVIIFAEKKFTATIFFTTNRL